jgi:hypothetical protein
LDLDWAAESSYVFCVPERSIVEHMQRAAYSKAEKETRNEESRPALSSFTRDGSFQLRIRPQQQRTLLSKSTTPAN